MMDYTKQEFMAITTGREIKDGELGLTDNPGLGVKLLADD